MGLVVLVVLMVLVVLVVMMVLVVLVVLMVLVVLVVLSHHSQDIRKSLFPGSHLLSVSCQERRHEQRTVQRLT